MQARIFTPGRIVALVLIGLTVAGLAYVRFKPDGGPVSVPKDAHAGQVTLKPCHYGTEKGSYEADCGTLVVPENRADPQSRLIALPVTRIRALTAEPGTPVFWLGGGPGLTNMQFEDASRFADGRDVVLVGYRGVDGSVRLDCPEVESALKHSPDLLADASFSAYADGFRACADRLTGDGVDLAAYGVPQQVDDLEAARKALGYETIDLLSESAGTRTAMIYSWRFPARVQRSVMLSVNPPGHFLWDEKTVDEQIARYAALCAKDDSCSKRTDDLAATIRQTAVAIPGRWFFLPIKEGNVRLASFFGLVESTSDAAPISAPMTIDSWLSASAGDAGGFWFQSLAADLFFPASFVWGEYAAVGRVDARAASDYFSSGPHGGGSTLGDAVNQFIWGGGRLVDGWPAVQDEDAYGSVPLSKVETLLIGGELDFATPPQVATQELLPYLANGHQVVLPGLGHSMSFWTEQPDAGAHLINAFLDSGRVDDSLYTPQSVDFTPGVTQTGLAEGLGGMMVGLPLLAVLSLLWMARRVHRRGRLGRKAGATLRSLYPLVLGLGGWLLGLMIVLVAFPAAPADHELLATFSVGVPIGVGLYLAWVRREWPAGAKTTGLAAAMVGALLGAWLGFNATGGLAALITTIVGAAAGGNLALLALDIVRERQGRDRPVETRAEETRAARARRVGPTPV